MEQNFNYNNFPVRTICDDDGQIWFAAIDICNALEYSNPNQAVDKLDDDEKKLASVFQMLGQKRKSWTINESGLYSLILRSSKPEAKLFRKWVTNEVLTSIRKAGIYITDNVQLKQSKLQELRKLIDEKKTLVSERKSVVKDLEKQVSKLEIEFWQIFGTDSNQLSLYSPEVMESLKS